MNDEKKIAKYFSKVNGSINYSENLNLLGLSKEVFLEGFKQYLLDHPDIIKFGIKGKSDSLQAGKHNIYFMADEKEADGIVRYDDIIFHSYVERLNAIKTNKENYGEIKECSIESLVDYYRQKNLTNFSDATFLCIANQVQIDKYCDYYEQHYKAIEEKIREILNRDKETAIAVFGSEIVDFASEKGFKLVDFNKCNFNKLFNNNYSVEEKLLLTDYLTVKNNQEKTDIFSVFKSHDKATLMHFIDENLTPSNADKYFYEVYTNGNLDALMDIKNDYPYDWQFFKNLKKVLNDETMNEYKFADYYDNHKEQIMNVMRMASDSYSIRNNGKDIEIEAKSVEELRKKMLHSNIIEKLQELNELDKSLCSRDDGKIEYTIKDLEEIQNKLSSLSTNILIKNSKKGLSDCVNSVINSIEERKNIKTKFLHPKFNKAQNERKKELDQKIHNEIKKIAHLNLLALSELTSNCETLRITEAIDYSDDDMVKLIETLQEQQNKNSEYHLNYLDTSATVIDPKGAQRMEEKANELTQKLRALAPNTNMSDKDLIEIYFTLFEDKKSICDTVVKSVHNVDQINIAIEMRKKMVDNKIVNDNKRELERIHTMNEKTLEDENSSTKEVIIKQHNEAKELQSTERIRHRRVDQYNEMMQQSEEKNNENGRSR